MDDRKTCNTLDADYERPDTASRSSPMMVGSARLNRNKVTERLELHLDLEDFTTLATLRARPSRDMYTVTKYTDTGSGTNVTKTAHTPRTIEVNLPKTYLTRCGSLMLYSDSRAMKDGTSRGAATPWNQRGTLNGSFKLEGHGMTPQSSVAESYPQWGKLIHTKHSTCTTPSTIDRQISRDRKEYLNLMHRREAEQSPRSWSYAVTPVSIVKPDNSHDVQPDDVIAYKSREPTNQEKYLTMIRQTWKGGRTVAEHKQLEAARELSRRVSPWTNEWIQKQSTIIYTEPVSVLSRRKSRKRTAPKTASPDSYDIENARIALLQSATSRVPTNTPLQASRVPRGQHRPVSNGGKRLVPQTTLYIPTVNSSITELTEY
ncbi:hypothetical protein MAR_014798 [Mya arenaria]|uniref:Uncharacterized protein n=1 Tax=Mya arenaria TaxID=6604 RepID=A0ABY7FIW7_MYAAR|nr:uncharacterized protein LOC128212319 [Mya arenaria]WAR20824.1 hypothetical protein MAR_014798 [Mya arenaria]